MRVAEHMTQKLNIDVATAGPEDQAVLRVLRRSKQWAGEGIVYDSDHSHADRLMEELQLTEERAVVTLALRESRKAQHKEDETTKKDGTGGEAHPSCMCVGEPGADRREGAPPSVCRRIYRRASSRSATSRAALEGSASSWSSAKAHRSRLRLGSLSPNHDHERRLACRGDQPMFPCVIPLFVKVRPCRSATSS